jgi:hypothetical protein
MDNLKQKTMYKLFLFLSFFFFIGSINAQTAPIKKKAYVDEQKILNVEAATPRAGYISAPYRKSDGNWYEKTDAGVEKLIIDTVAMLATKYDLQNVSIDTINEIATKYDLSNISVDTINEIATKYDLQNISIDTVLEIATKYDLDIFDKSIITDGTTITGNGTLGNELTLDTTNLIATKTDLSNLTGGSVDTLNEIATKYDLTGITSDNIYSADGTLTGDRTVTMGGNDINFTGGSIGINSIAPVSPLTVLPSVVTDNNAIITVGEGGTNNSDPAISILRVTDLGGLNSPHGFVDGTHFQRSTNGLAYASFDANTRILGTANYDHYAAFQVGNVYNSSGTMDYFYSYFSKPTISGGIVTNLYGSYIARPVLSGGLITNNYGLYIEQQDKGSTLSEAIHTEGGKWYMLERTGTGDVNSIEINRNTFGVGDSHFLAFKGFGNNAVSIGAEMRSLDDADFILKTSKNNVLTERLRVDEDGLMTLGANYQTGGVFTSTSKDFIVIDGNGDLKKRNILSSELASPLADADQTLVSNRIVTGANFDFDIVGIKDFEIESNNNKFYYAGAAGNIKRFNLSRGAAAAVGDRDIISWDDAGFEYAAIASQITSGLDGEIHFQIKDTNSTPDDKVSITKDGLKTLGNNWSTGGVRDSGGDLGTSNQILSSTVTGTDWIDAQDPAAGMDAVVSNRSYVDNAAALVDLSSGQVYYNTTSNAFVVLP